MLSHDVGIKFDTLMKINYTRHYFAYGKPANNGFTNIINVDLDIT